MSRSNVFGILLKAVKTQLTEVGALRSTARMGSENESKLAEEYQRFNIIVVAFLNCYLDEVSTQIARGRKWSDPHALLEVTIDGFTFRIPVSKLEKLDGELAKKVKIKMSPKVEICAQSWDGYKSRHVIRCQSREEAIAKALEDSKDSEHKFLRSIIDFDDEDRVLIHLEHGYESHGWRIHHSYFYFDPNAQVISGVDEETGEHYECHLLTILEDECYWSVIEGIHPYDG